VRIIAFNTLFNKTKINNLVLLNKQFLVKRKDINNCVFLTRSLRYSFVQLACVKHIISVHSEPGSNSFRIV